MKNNRSKVETIVVPPPYRGGVRGGDVVSENMKTINFFLIFSITLLLIAFARFLHPATYSYSVLLIIATLTSILGLILIIKENP